MAEPEYEQSPYQKLHRGGALILVVASLLVNVSLLFGAEGSITDAREMRTHAYMVLPLMLIWSSDLLASKAIEVSGGWLKADNADTALRIGGWLLLLLLLVAANSRFFF